MPNSGVSQRLSAPSTLVVMPEHAGHDPDQDVIDAGYKLLREQIFPLVN